MKGGGWTTVLTVVHMQLWTHEVYLPVRLPLEVHRGHREEVSVGAGWERRKTRRVVLAQCPRQVVHAVDLLALRLAFLSICAEEVLRESGVRAR